MPPELLRSGKMSSAGDVYAFGIMMWELLSGHSAFSGLHFAEVIERVAVRGERPQVPGEPSLSSIRASLGTGTGAGGGEIGGADGAGGAAEAEVSGAAASDAFEAAGPPPAAAPWPQDYMSLMRSCWAADPGQRPSFTQVLAQLDAMLATRGQPTQAQLLRIALTTSLPAQDGNRHSLARTGSEGPTRAPYQYGGLASSGGGRRVGFLPAAPLGHRLGLGPGAQLPDARPSFLCDSALDL